MAVADIHPSIADLEAFTLGTLEGSSLEGVEAHVADCSICQERAAGTSGDALVELLRRVHAQVAHRIDTVAAAQEQTESPIPATIEAVTPPPAAPTGTVAYLVIPPELARHERYRIVRLLGEGGMGAVYEAEHRVMQRAVALKVINRAFTANPAAVERFRREVHAVARLSHPNIVTIYDAEDAGNTLFLVMEYVEGVSLARMVKERGPLPVAEACAYVRQAALGLQHAHERGMVHRDVKPDNLIRCADGTVKVLDFGLAALTAERGGGLTETNVVMGTPDSMAPEQAENPRNADIRADVYSLGCTLYYLLTGDVPYPAPTPMGRILAHREQALPSPRQARPEVAPELAAVVARLLAKKPEDRYPTPSEVAVALEPFTHAAAVEPPRKRQPFLAAVAALLAGIVLAGAIVYRIQTDRGELVVTTVSDDVEVIITQGGKLVRIIDTKTDKSITLRSGVYELELKNAGEGLKLNIDKVDLTRGETVLAKIERVAKPAADGAEVGVRRDITWPGGAENIYSASFSPDGHYYLATGETGTSLRVWETATGKEVANLAGNECGVFLPDNRHLLSPSPDKAMVLWDVPSGKVVRRFTGHTDWINWIALSADGKRAATSDIGGAVRLWDVTTGERLFARSAHTGACFPLLSRDGRRILTVGRADSAIRLWDAASGEVVRSWEIKNGEVIFIAAFLPDDRSFVTVSQEGNVARWDKDSDAPKSLLKMGRVLSAWGLSPDGRQVLLGLGNERAVHLYDLRGGREVGRIELPTPPCFLMGVSPDGRYGATAVSVGTTNGAARVYLFRLPNPQAPKKP